MASVTLDKLWLHAADDLSDNLAVYVDAIRDTPSKAGSPRVYASGRVRSITRVGVRSSLAVRCEQVARADLAVLEGWVGTTLMLREPRGRKRFGVYYSLDVEEIEAVDLVNVAFTFMTITASEEV